MKFNRVFPKCCHWIQWQQESPPAWKQDAYHPPCSDYSFCCPILADPPPRVDWNPPAGWTWSPPLAEPDPPPPGWTWPPPAGPDPSPFLDLTPPTSWTWPPPNWTEDWPPLWTDRIMDRRMSKHYLPVILRMRVVKIILFYNENYCAQTYHLVKERAQWHW